MKRSGVEWLCVPALCLASGCDSSLVREAKDAEADGRVISNDLMAFQYPQAYRPGNPPYLERDFEAGADFICDQIELERGRDLCAEADINWRH